MKISTIFKNTLFICCLGMSSTLSLAKVYNTEPLHAKVTTSRSSLDSSTPEFKAGFRTLVEAKIEGLPIKFNQGDVIETDDIPLAQDELLHLTIINPHNTQNGPYHNVHDLSFSIGGLSYDPSLKLDTFVANPKEKYWSLLKPESTSIEYQYQCKDAGETDQFSSKINLFPHDHYHPVITTATLRINITPSALEDSSRL